MSFTEHLLQGISDEERRSGEKQVFISHEFRSKDLRVKLERALKQLELEAYFADKEVTGKFILNKICKKILITRASIVDLSTSNPNVYFELGVAIGLNKPIFIVLREGAAVPTLLENFVKLRFTSYAGLEQSLITYAPKWLTESIEHHLLYNTHCHFISVPCPDRLPPTPWLNSQRRYLLIDQIEHRDGNNQLRFAGDPDLSAELRAALDMFQYLPILLDDVPLTDAFRFCDYCRSLRSSHFVLCHLDKRSSANVYLLLGLVTGLGLPSLLLIHRELDAQGRPLFSLPSMLRGVDAFAYEHYSEIGDRLGDAVEGFIEEQKGKRGISKALVFREWARPEKYQEPEPEPTQLTETELSSRLQDVIDRIHGARQDEDGVVRSILLGVQTLLGKPNITASLMLLKSPMPQDQAVLERDWYSLDPKGKLIKTSLPIVYASLSREVVETKQGLVVNNVPASRWQPFDSPEHKAVVQSAIDVPILSDDQVLGVIEAASPNEDVFGDRDVRVIELLSAQLALVLDGLRQGLPDASSLAEDASMPTPSDVPAFEYDVFILYSSKDAKWVRGELLTRLEAEGFRVCIDFQDFEIGLPRMINMERAATTSRHILLVLTPNYLQSDWVEFDMLMLQVLDPASRQRRLIPLIKEPSQLPLRLQALTHVDFTDPDKEESAWGRLISALGAPSDVLQLDHVDSSTSPALAPLPQSFPKHNQRLRIFLNHSSSDKLAVRSLYQQLRAAGFAPWLDEEELLPGQDWQQEIHNAIRTSDVIIICLSRTSVTRNGFINQEITYALDVADEQPTGTAFIIPVRLEECEVPERLRQWQWVNLFEEDGFERLMQALRLRAGQIGIPFDQSSTPAQDSVDGTVLVAPLERTVAGASLIQSVILLVDNDPEFLMSRRETLEQAGFLVKAAAGVDEARRMLERGGIDLAILGLRLVDDTDDKDYSGLELAKQVAGRIPIIINTTFPTFELIREALAPQVNGLPAAVNVIAKREGVQALITAIDEALSRQSKPDKAGNIRVLHVAVAATSDVQAERASLERVIAELNRGIAVDRRLRLELTQWESDVLPGFRENGAQGMIDSILRSQSDLLIGIFWKSIGTRAADEYSGIELEFQLAYESWRREGQPQMMVYFRDSSYTPTTPEEVDQWARVLKFKQEFSQEGLWWSYRSPQDFEKLVRQHLNQLIRQYKPPSLD